jgi:integrase/recombinase XerD
MTPEKEITDMRDQARNAALERVRLGPLGSIVDRFVSDLQARGHATRTIGEYLSYIERLGRWMAQDGRLITTLNESTLQGFLAGLTGSVRRRARAATRRLLSTLRKTGMVSSVSRPITPAQDLIRRFLTAFQRSRGVLASTCRQYSLYVGRFLAFRFPSSNEVPDLATITAHDVRGFVAQHAEQGRTGAAKAAAKALRAFLRYLVQEGRCCPDLVAAVPTVARRHSPVPRFLTETQLRGLIASFDRSSATGRRDYAIAQCLWQLALRAGEVVALHLDDVDWRAGTVHIGTSKSRRAAILPLPQEVGRAIADYLRHGRPTTTDRHLFLTHTVPIGRPLQSSAARQTIRRAFNRAGLAVRSKGTHTLRHTAATSMTCRGASLKEVADVLRHRNLDTTMIYARVDLPALRSVALPWPEVR